MSTKLISFFLIFALTSAQATFAQTKPEKTASVNPKGKAVPLSQAIQPKTEALQAGEKLIWDYWYTATIQKKHKYGYYNDRVVQLDGKIRFKNQFWKMEEGFINEEQLSSIANDDSNLSPVLFNFRSNYRSTIINVDGTAKDGMLTIKIRRGEKDLEPITKGLPKTLFTAALFPVWLGRQLPSMQPGKSVNFLTLMEDGSNADFSTVAGRATLVAGDSISAATKSKKIEVDMGGQKTYWYVDSQGAPYRISMPAQFLEVERVSKDRAVGFFK
jgi:hypothetical protein